MKKALFKETLRSIRRSSARFVSIIAIVALGISFFAGIKATAPDMKETAELYFDRSNLMDIRVISTVGLTDDDILALKSADGVSEVMPSRFVDGILKSDGKSIGDIDGSEMTCRAISLDFDAARSYDESGSAGESYMNRVTLLEGQWPDSPDECVVDCSTLSAPEQFKIGNSISLSGDNSNIENKLTQTEFKIVGIVRTPLYISFERGNTTIGSGKLGTFIFVSDEIFSLDYYTEAFISVAGADSLNPYSEEYRSFIAPVMERIEEIAAGRLPLRVEYVRSQTQSQVASGETTLAQKRAEFDQKIADAQRRLDELKELVATGREQIDAKKEEFNASLSDAQREIYMSTDEYNEKYAQWRQKQDELNTLKLQMAKLQSAQDEYNRAALLLENAKAQIDSAQRSVDSLESLVVNTRTALDYFQDNQNQSKEELAGWLQDSGLPADQIERLTQALNSFTAVGTAEEMIAYLSPMLDDYTLQLQASREELAAATAEYNSNSEKLAQAAEQLREYEGAREQLTAAEIELQEIERRLNSAGLGIEIGQLELSMSQQQLRSEIELAETQLAAAQAKAQTADEDFERERAAALEELQKAELDLAEAKALLAGLDSAEWMIQDRDDLPGYTGYEQTADRMGAFAQVFPIFFFLVAAMVCLTTMARMVDEERTQLGTLKALGYSGSAIASKYLIYAVSASLIGSVIGLLLGFYIFPKAIFAAYGIMYDLPPCIIRFKWSYALIGTAISIVSTCAAALLACRRELRLNPAKLMRPKAPKTGKRIVLERIGFIWSHMNFTSKVTARNLFRNKRRFVTTFIGVAGCTALLLTGFGLGNSITAIMDNQFGDDGVCNYDVQIVLSSGYGTQDGEPQVMQTIRGKSEISKAMMTHMEVIEGSSERSDEKVEINLLIPEDAAALPEFVRLRNRLDGNNLTLGDDGVIITEKFAQKTDSEVGDDIIITSGGKNFSVPVSGIVENYTFHYVYMSPALYQEVFASSPSFNYVTAILGDNVNQAQKESLAVDLMKQDGIDAVAYTTQTIETFDTIISSLNLVVAIFIIAAGALAFVVLYNLANINLNERTREIATIKVLGFRDMEASEYLMRENIILTLLGVAVGLVLGIFLHRYVVSVAEIDVVMFGRTIKPLSYVLAVLLSMAFSLLVNFIMHRKLKKVDLVGSLKAVE